mgnify:FL=1
MPNGDTFSLGDRGALWNAYLRAVSDFPMLDKVLAAQGGYNVTVYPLLATIPGAVPQGSGEFDVKEWRFKCSLLGIAGAEINNWGNTIFAKTKDALPPKA